MLSDRHSGGWDVEITDRTPRVSARIYTLSPEALKAKAVGPIWRANGRLAATGHGGRYRTRLGVAGRRSRSWSRSTRLSEQPRLSGDHALRFCPRRTYAVPCEP
jgi:hypothetical protein